MRKIKTFAATYVVGILVCAIFAVIFFFIGAKPLMEINGIRKNGVETTASVYKLEESNNAINNEATYYFLVEYTDADGNVVKGKTLNYYSLDVSQDVYDRIAVGQTVNIKIHYLNGKVVGEDGVTGMMGTIFTVVCVVAALGALAFLAVLIKTILAASAMNKALVSGEAAEGVFLEAGKPMAMGRTRYYGVKYSFTDAQGNEKVVKTPKAYTYDDVETLRAVKKFEVRCMGKTSVIAFDFDNYNPAQTMQAPPSDPFADR